MLLFLFTLILLIIFIFVAQFNYILQRERNGHFYLYTMEVL